MRCLFACIVVVLPTTNMLRAEPTPVSYYREIRPLLQQHCLGCHQPAKSFGGYLMITYADLLKAGDSGKPAIVPGKPEESYLFEEIMIRDGKAEMPKNREPLKPDQIEKVRLWIQQGAKDDTPASALAKTIDAEHPPTYPQLPVVTALAVAPDGKHLAVSGYHEVLIYDLTGKLEARLVGLAEQIQSLAYSPDGKWLAVSGGDPGRFGEIQIWEVEKKRLRVSVPVSFDTTFGVSWSHDGTKVAFGCADNTVRAIEASSGKQVLFQGAHNDWVLATTFSTDSKHLVSVSRDRSMKLTEVETQRFIDNITSITPGALKGGLTTVALRPNKSGKMAPIPEDAPKSEPKLYDELLIGGSDGVPRLYKMHREVKRVIGDDANRIREFERLPGRIYSAAFDADGKRFVVGSSDDGVGEVRVYEVDTGKKLARAEGKYGPIYAVAFSTDGKSVITAGFDGMIRIYDAATGKPIKEFPSAPRS